MKYTKLKIGGREFSLAFTLNVNNQLDDVIHEYKVSDIGDYVRGQGREMLAVLTAMARQGQKLNGRILDVDADWFGSHIPYRMSSLVKIQVALLDAVSIGMRMETEDDDDGIEVDVVLEELKKKEKADG